MTKRLSLFAILGAFPLAASAAPLYSESFDTDVTSAWTFASSIPSNAGNGNFVDTATNGAGGEANFFFNYSSIGIPSAPRSTGGTTIGMKLEANVYSTSTLAQTFSGMSVTPKGQNFSGDYTLSFDSWQNAIGPFPLGGSSSTMMAFAGIGATGTAAQFPGGTVNAIGFAASSDGNTAMDYRAYNGSTVQSAVGVFAANSQANTDAYYMSKFNGVIPAAQTAINAKQTGVVPSGALGFAWHQWDITKTGSTITWKVDNYLIATVTNASNTGNIFFGQFDINAAGSTDPDSRALTFGLIDNVTVTAPQAVPEPASIAALGLGSLALLRRRRKA